MSRTVRLLHPTIFQPAIGSSTPHNLITAGTKDTSKSKMELAKVPDAGSGPPSSNQTAIPIRWEMPQNGFVPMNMARRYQAGGAPNSFNLTAATSTSTEATVHGDQAFRANYQGDTSRFRNLPANVPDEPNTALWLTGLPADISYTELFDNLAQRGRLFSVFINVANKASGHTTAAATIAFFHAASTQQLYDVSNSGPGFFIRGHPIKIHHNRRKASEAQTKPHQTTQHGRPSRVVSISGPGEILDLFSLLNYFEQRFYFHVDRVEPQLHHDAAIVAYEIRFASFYCQAEMAVMSVNRDMKFRDARVQISYSTDPCESGE